MKHLLGLLFCGLLLLLGSCGGQETGSMEPTGDIVPTETPEPTPVETPFVLRNGEGLTVARRFAPPRGFSRVAAEDGSFAAWLRELPLREDGTPLHHSDGTAVAGAVFDSVVDFGGMTRLMEKTDFMLSLHAGYLYSQQAYAQMTYHFYSGFPFEFNQWANGNRIQVDGNKVNWIQKESPDNSEAAFGAFLLQLHMYANPLSLHHDTKPLGAADMGAMLTRNRTDGKGYDNALMIVDMAADASGNTALLLAGCGTPTQEGYILANSLDPDNSPWFIVPESGIMETSDGVYALDSLIGFRS